MTNDEVAAKLFRFLYERGADIDPFNVAEKLKALGLVEAQTATENGEYYLEGDMILVPTDTGQRLLAAARRVS